MLGIFDSGIGGLTVVRELLRRHPDASFVYLGDTARAPYGNKSSETIARYAVEDARFLLSQGAETLVVACNTMSAHALDALRQAYPQVRLFDVIGPAVNVAARTSHGRVGVIGTRATISSGVYDTGLKRIRPELSVISAACPLFVPLAEEGMFEARETKMITRRYLSPIIQAQADTVILGCTHYPLLMSVIRSRVGRRTRIIDSPSAVLDAIEQQDPTQLTSSLNSLQRYCFTDENPRTQEIVQTWLGRTMNCERVVF